MSSTSPTLSFLAQYVFAEGVSMSLSLPWSSFEHMVGNWLVTSTDDSHPVRLEELIERFLPMPPEIHRVRLPLTTDGQLRNVLELGRSEIADHKLREDLEGVGESEGKGESLTLLVLDE